MKEEKGENLKKIIIECIYLAKISELLKMKLITEDEFFQIKKTLKTI